MAGAYHHHAEPSAISNDDSNFNVNEQTSTNPQSAGEKQWFLTTGTFRGTPAACGSCN